ncbi:MAG: homoserine kinase [Acidobacteria bacterium]|nr:homoserine kinase [Acidobacteriota bacterium]
MTTSHTRIRVPSSTSNLGPGFDSQGLALNLYLTIDVAPTTDSHLTFTFSGEGATELNSAAENNLIHTAMQFVAKREGVALQAARLTVTNDIPLARGLGSSAAAIIAGFSAFEVITGTTLCEDKLLAYATAMEHHSDNVAAALLGSFVVSCVTDDGSVRASRVQWPDDIRAVVAIPNFKVRTAASRRVVPLQVSRQDAVFNIQRAALFVAAIAERRYDLLREAMRDKLHQPFRAALVPGLAEVLQLEKVDGLLGAALSGSGPTVFALATHNFDHVAKVIAACFESRGIECATRFLEVETVGRVIQQL